MSMNYRQVSKYLITLILLVCPQLTFASPSTTINVPNSFNPNTTISSSAVNADFNEVSTKYNTHTHTDITQVGVITSGTWAASPIQSSYVAQGAGAITGEVKIWAGTTSNIPSGWLACDGSNVSRTTYSALFAIVGTNYGIGDGSTTFTLPAWNSDKFVRGSSTAGTSGGSDTHSHTGVTGSHTLDVTEIPSHSHNVSGFQNGGGSGLKVNTEANSAVAGGTVATSSTGGGAGHTHTISTDNNIPAYQTGIFIIKT